MNTPSRTGLTAVVALAECAHLAWEHLNGGIHSHHVLNRADLPAISNAWGLLLPALTWFAVSRVQRRAAGAATAAQASSQLPTSVLAGFFAALLFGGLLAGSFAGGYQPVTEGLFQSLFVLALLLPIYRAECVLGFVLGMTFTFGAVLPTAVAAVFAALSAIAHLVLRPAMRALWARIKPR